jgi:hypothetical protein
LAFVCFLSFIQEKNKEWIVVDEDEFESNSIKYGYSIELKRETLKALKRLKEEVRRGNFPFNNQVASLFENQNSYTRSRYCFSY